MASDHISGVTGPHVFLRTMKAVILFRLNVIYKMLAFSDET